MSLRAFLLLALHTVFLLPSARAQDDAQHPTADNPIVVVETVPPPVTPEEPEEEPLPPDDPFGARRVRIGFTFLGGPTVPSGNGDAGGFGGASLRLGVQLDRTFSVYYQAMGVVGGYDVTAAGTRTANVFLGVYNTVLGGITLADHVDLGFGPSIDSIASISAEASDDTASVTAFAGTAFGLHARFALVMGHMNLHWRRRTGFTLTCDLHPTFIDGRVLFTTAFGLGGEWL